MSGPFIPTARDLFAAIKANDSARVNRILDEGQLDPDVDLHERDIPVFTTRTGANDGWFSVKPVLVLARLSLSLT
jgi:hypothetical protein